MSKLSKPEAMLFDLDGTLFQSETILVPAYERTFEKLQEMGLHVGEVPPVERMLACLGMMLDAIWDRIWPGMPEQTKRVADDIFMKYQLEALEGGLGRLYPGVAETLQALHDAGVRLFVASNGQEKYVDRVVDRLGLGDLFEDLYSAGKYQTASKVDLVRMLLDRYEVKTAWMVGDRSSDVEAGLANELVVIGCAYATFGAPAELDGSTVIIRTFDELLAL
jgi:phosphoglycolate phosphatase-like HAD superfamily hydrolase